MEEVRRYVHGPFYDHISYSRHCYSEVVVQLPKDVVVEVVLTVVAVEGSRHAAEMEECSFVECAK